MQQQYGDMHPAATKAKRGRKPRVEPIQDIRKDRIQTRALTYANVVQEQNNTRYATHYSVTDDRSLLSSNQVLYPNMRHVPTTMPYSMPQQMAQPSTNSTSEQPMVSRYNTRRAVQSIPLVSAPTTTRYYNTPRPQVSRQIQHVQQMNMPVPVEYPVPKQTKEQSSQSDLTITEDEYKMLKLLRSKQIIELSQLKIIMEKSYKYDQKPPEKLPEDEPDEERTPIEKETYNQIVQYSNLSKCKILNFMSNFVKSQEKTATAVQQQTRAIQFQAMFNQAMVNQPLPQGYLQIKHQQERDTAPSIPQWYSEKTHQENMSPNDETVNIRTPNQQQVPEETLNEGLHIPTLIGHRNTPGTLPHRVSYISPHILQAAALCLNNNYNHYGMSAYLHNRPSIQLPWGA